MNATAEQLPPITVDLDVHPLTTQGAVAIRDNVRRYRTRMLELGRAVTIIRITPADAQRLRDEITRQATRDARKTGTKAPPLAGFTFGGVPVQTWGP